MRERIRGYADAVVEEATHDEAAQLADDLASVRDVIAGSDDLRLVMGDIGVASHARRGVMNDVFGAHIGAESLRLILYVVETDRAPDVVDDVTWLASRTAAARDGLQPVGADILGHHAALDRVDGYAAAVLADLAGPASAGDGTSDAGSAEASVASGTSADAEADRARLAEIEDELFRFERIVAGSDELLEVLTTREVDGPARHALVADLLGTKAAPATVRLAVYPTAIGRPRDYLELLDALVARVAAESRRRIAEVRAAVELTEAQRDRLGGVLSRLVGQQVDVRVVVDATVIGGFVATIGDTVIDGSARHRLDLLKERLVTSEAASTS